MTETIHKQVLQITDKQVLSMPKWAIIRHIGFQGNDLCVWYQCDVGMPKENVTFSIYGTGHNIEIEGSGQIYDTTVIDQSNGFVWHIFHSITA